MTDQLIVFHCQFFSVFLPFLRHKDMTRICTPVAFLSLVVCTLYDRHLSVVGSRSVGDTCSIFLDM